MANDPSKGMLPEYAEEPEMQFDFSNNAALHAAAADYQKRKKEWEDRATIKAPEIPKEDPLVRSLYEQRQKARKDYEAQIPGLSDSLYSQAAGQGRRELDGATRGIRSNFNSRGLLNSGKRASAEMGADADIRSGLAAKRTDINRGLLSNLEGMESDEFSLASMLAQPGVNAAQPFLSRMKSNAAADASDSQAQAQMFAGIGSGVGAVGGGLLANSIYGQRSATPPPAAATRGGTSDYGAAPRMYGAGGFRGTDRLNRNPYGAGGGW